MSYDSSQQLSTYQPTQAGVTPTSTVGQRSVPMTPGIQGVIDRMQGRLPATQDALKQTEDQKSSGGEGFVSGAYNWLTEHTVGEAVQGFKSAATAGMAVLGAANKWVVTPALGAGVYAMMGSAERDRLSAKYGCGGGNFIDHQNCMRQFWQGEGNPLPWTAKLAAEIAIDPTSYIGMGLWGSGEMKAASIITDGLAASESGTEGAGLVAKTIQGATAPLSRFQKIMKMTGILQTPEAQPFFQGIKDGNVTHDAIDGFVNLLDKHGLTINPDMAKDYLKFTKPGAFRALQPGVFTRLFSPLQLHRVMGPVDLGLETLWRTPFAIAGPAVGAGAEKAGGLGIKLIDAFAASPAGKAAASQAAFWGPKMARQLPFAIEQAGKEGEGKMGLWSYLMQPTAASFDNEVSRRMDVMWDGMGTYTAQHPILHDIPQLLRDIRYPGRAIDDKALGLMPEDRTLLVEGVKSMPKDAYDAMVNTTDETVLRDRVQSVVRDRLAKATAIRDMPRISAAELTLPNHMWDFMGKMVDIWRPLVTTWNPAFHILNVMGNLVERGGSDLVIHASPTLAGTMAEHGYPRQMVPLMGENFVQLMKGLVGQGVAKTGLPEEAARELHQVSMAGVNMGHVVSSVAPASAYGMEIGNTIKESGILGKLKQGHAILSAMSARADFGAQLHHFTTGMSKDFLRQVLTAAPESQLTRIKVALQAARDSNRISPLFHDQVEAALPMLMTDPKAGLDQLMRDFSYENIRANDIRGMLGPVDPESHVAFENSLANSVDTSMPREALMDAAEAGHRMATGTGPIRAMIKTHKQFISQVDGMMAQAFPEHYKPGDFTQLHKATLNVMRKTINTSMNAIRPYDAEQAARLAGDAGQSLPIASTNFDALMTHHIATAAQAHGGLTMSVLPSYLEVSRRWAHDVGTHLGQAHDAVAAYKTAIETGDDIGMRAALNSMEAAHGDFKPLADRMAAGDVPTFSDVVGQYSSTAESVWHQYLAAKLGVGNDLVTHIALGKVGPAEIGKSVANWENHLFRRGGTEAEAARNIQWSNYLADIQGFRGLQVPVINPATRATDMKRLPVLDDMISTGTRDFANPEEKATFQNTVQRMNKTENQFNGDMMTGPEKMELKTLRAAEKTDAGLNDVEQARLGDLEAKLFNDQAPVSAEAVDPKLAEMRALFQKGKVKLTDEEIAKLQEERTTIATRLHDAPTRPYEQIELDHINNLNMLGREAASVVQKIMPHNYEQQLNGIWANIKNRIMTHGLNETSDREGLKFLYGHLRNLADIGSDPTIRGEVDAALSQAGKAGYTRMNQMMANYSQSNNMRALVSSIIPFASFQMHLPTYLARTFMERPGVIFAMNHFAQAAQGNYGATGGLVLGTMMGQTFVFGPQLRFSYLPIMAGNIFGSKDDNPATQLSNIVSAFGFSPGPHVQLAMDAGNRIATQLGLPQAAPEFKEGLIPQWRWLQDITALTSLNNSEGLSIPMIAPSNDMREREVSRELASRTHDALDEARRTAGRDLYPEEINDIRKSIAQTQTESARRSVAGRDLATAMIPGLKVHEANIDSVRTEAAKIIEGFGVKGVDNANVSAKFKELDTMQKQQLFRQLPEFEDVLAVPPWQETGQAKDVRQARETYFKTRDDLFAQYTSEQRDADTALKAGSITVKQWRDIHDRISKNRAGGLQAIEQDPNFKPFLDQEKQSPQKPEEQAYTNFTKLTATDVNNNGVIDDEDMKAFFETRNAYLANQPGWIQDYIHQRKAFNDTPVEQEHDAASRVLNNFLAIPKWVGFSPQDSMVAQRVLAKVNQAAQLIPGSTDERKLIMTLPGLTPQERLLALKAKGAQLNTARHSFWVGHPELNQWFPEFAPSNPTAQKQVFSPQRARQFLTPKSVTSY